MNPQAFALPNGKKISKLGLGCSSAWASQAVSDERAIAALDAAQAAGINHFDTGPSYGSGRAETRLGHWLKRQSRDELVVSTKVGSNLINGVNKRSFQSDDMEASLRESLKRLNTDYVDILYLHGPLIPEITPEVLSFLHEIKSQGLASLVGVNSFSLEVLHHLVGLDIDVVMPEYNLANQTAAEVIEHLRADGKVILSGTALAQAIFAPSTFFPWNPTQVWYLLRQLRHGTRRLRGGMALRRKLSQLNRPPAESAIQFVLANPHIQGAVFGSTSEKHIQANALAAEIALPKNALAILSDRNSSA